LYEYSWNKKASVLYVEQPSGVGLSWSADEAHHSTNDEQASADNLLFLKAFFEVFPSFKQNDFYVTGESYGGHYVSTPHTHVDVPLYHIAPLCRCTQLTCHESLVGPTTLLSHLGRSCFRAIDQHERLLYRQSGHQQRRKSPPRPAVPRSPRFDHKISTRANHDFQAGLCPLLARKIIPSVSCLTSWRAFCAVVLQRERVVRRQLYQISP
jgi:hypothetical protein